MCYALSVGACDILGGDLVAKGVEDVDSVAGMAGYLSGLLAVGEIHAYADDVVGIHGEVEWIRDDLGAIWDIDGFVAGEGDGL